MRKVWAATSHHDIYPTRSKLENYPASSIQCFIFMMSVRDAMIIWPCNNTTVHEYEPVHRTASHPYKTVSLRIHATYQMEHPLKIEREAVLRFRRPASCRACCDSPPRTMVNICTRYAHHKVIIERRQTTATVCAAASLSPTNLHKTTSGLGRMQSGQRRVLRRLQFIPIHNWKFVLP